MPEAIGFVNGYAPAYTFAAKEGRPLVSYDYYLSPTRPEADAVADLPLEGKVSFISLLSKEEGGVVTYDVKINFDVPEGAGIRAGMSSTADIVVAEHTNVLLVPSRAIKQNSQGNTVVQVSVNGQIEERIMMTFLNRGINTTVVDDLPQSQQISL
jgi:multidrug efflux pump subunit AcrA (membrane-fusion protein)